MCQVSQEKMTTALTIMLKVDAISLYAARRKDCDTYSKAMEVLPGWYNSAEKGAEL